MGVPCSGPAGTGGGHRRRTLAARALLLSDEADERLLAVMAAHGNICKYLDLPLQHAEPEICSK